MFDVRGYARAPKHGTIDPPARGRPDVITLGYTGLDERATQHPTCASIRCPTRSILSDRRPAAQLRRASCPASVAPAIRAPRYRRHPTHRRASIFEIDAAAQAAPLDHRSGRCPSRREAPNRLASAGSRSTTPFVLIRELVPRVGDRRAPSIDTDHEMLNAVLRRASPTCACSPTLAAAISLGRHPLVQRAVRPRQPDHRAADAALQPEIAYGTPALPGRAPGHAGRRLARRGARQDPARDAARARWRALGEVPHTPYYGSVDATPLFLMLLGETCAGPTTATCSHELRPNVEAALEWIDSYGDLDGDGYVEYLQPLADAASATRAGRTRTTPSRSRDGTLAEPPIALAEVQGYVYARQARAGRAVSRRCGETDARRGLRAAGRRAPDAASAATSGCQTIGFFAHGARRTTSARSDGRQLERRPLPLDRPARRRARPRRGRRLVATDMLCGWGMRTLEQPASRRSTR